jgi:hypothetical protein
MAQRTAPNGRTGLGARFGRPRVQITSDGARTVGDVSSGSSQLRSTSGAKLTLRPRPAAAATVAASAASSVERNGEPGVVSGAMEVAVLFAWNHVTSSRTWVAPVEARLASERWLAAVP